MTTLYRPVLIESAEQLRTLPEGTIMRSRTGALCETGLVPGTDEPCVWGEGWLSIADAHEHLAPFSALVPIEAEEQTTRDISPEVGTYGPDDEIPEHHLGPRRTRYITHWEEA